jgi:predicted nucleic acid-binding protein
MTVLFDTSFLLAVAFERDQNHFVAAAAMREIKTTRLVVEPVVVEVFFMMTARLSYDRAIRLFQLLQTPAFQIISLTFDDRQRMIELMQRYRDAQLDIADVAQIAVAERMGVSRIYTFDKRDFSLVTPRHISHFEIIP